jgi:beta-barrel assembly-enhancing protease
MQARYADGRVALTTEIVCELGVEALSFELGGEEQVWPYKQLARADDNNRSLVLKRKPDTGERVSFDLAAKPELRRAAPNLFRARARGIESLATFGAIFVSAWLLAGVFLVGVPMAAGPIADIVPSRYRERVALIAWSQIEEAMGRCDDSYEGEEAEYILYDLAQRMMLAANVPQRDQVQVLIYDPYTEFPFPNAFALPDNTIVVTSDLIALAEHPDEIAGVLAHEIAHIEHNHVMKNVIRNVGAGIFVDVVFGGGGAGQAIALASVNLASLGYSREDEADADSRALAYLSGAYIDAGGFGRMFERLEKAAKNLGIGDIPLLLSSHPASRARAEAARAHAQAGLAPSLNQEDWLMVRSACRQEDEAFVE